MTDQEPYRIPRLGIDFVKLERHCPRCHVHRYHSARHRREGTRHVVNISCAECGYGWTGRFKKDEWNDEA